MFIETIYQMKILHQIAASTLVDIIIYDYVILL